MLPSSFLFLLRRGLLVLWPLQLRHSLSLSLLLLLLLCSRSLAQILGPVGLQLVKCLLTLLGTHPGNPHYALYNVQDADTRFLEMMALLRNLVFGQPFLYGPTSSENHNNDDLVGLRMLRDQFRYLEVRIIALPCSSPFLSAPVWALSVLLHAPAESAPQADLLVCSAGFCLPSAPHLHAHWRVTVPSYRDAENG